MSTHAKLYRRLAWVYFVLAAISLLWTIYWPILGEEPNYTTTLLDMALNHHWIQPLKWSGEIYARPPLMNWVALPLLSVVGMRHAIVATRLVTALSTIATAGSIVWFVRQLRVQHMAAFPILCGAVFLTGDVLLARGWIAYADPLFALWVFLSMACLYLACVRQSHVYLIVSAGAVFLGFLTKEPTAYVFYITAGFCLLASGVGGAYVRRWQTWVIGVVALVLPWLAWQAINLHGTHLALRGDAWAELFGSMGGLAYFFKIRWHLVVDYLLTYNLVLVAFLLALWAKKSEAILPKSHQRCMVLIIILSCLPYLLPNGHAVIFRRYFLPVLPWVAIYVAHTVLRTRQAVVISFFVACFLCLAVKYYLVVSGHMFMHGHLDPVQSLSVRPMAQQIVQRSRGRVCFNVPGYYRKSVGLVANPVLGALDMELAANYHHILALCPWQRRCHWAGRHRTRHRVWYDRLVCHYSWPHRLAHKRLAYHYVLAETVAPSGHGWHLVQHFASLAQLHGHPYAQVNLYYHL